VTYKEALATACDDPQVLRAAGLAEGAKVVDILVHLLGVIAK
jgi:hypothetical protein